jgi:hypothetical protein
MVSASGLTYRVLVDSPHPGRVGGVFTLLSGPPGERVANGKDEIDTWIAAANDLGDLRPAIRRPPRCLVLDAA